MSLYDDVEDDFVGVIGGVKEKQSDMIGGGNYKS